MIQSRDELILEKNKDDEDENGDDEGNAVAPRGEWST
jgi:hypothetical protein